MLWDSSRKCLDTLERLQAITPIKIHSTQRLVKRLKNNDAMYEISLIINKEFISLLLSFGKDLVVQGPEKLKEIVKSELKTSENY